MARPFNEFRSTVMDKIRSDKKLKASGMSTGIVRKLAFRPLVLFHVFVELRETYQQETGLSASDEGASAGQFLEWLLEFIKENWDTILQMILSFIM